MHIGMAGEQGSGTLRCSTITEGRLSRHAFMVQGKSRNVLADDHFNREGLLYGARKFRILTVWCYIHREAPSVQARHCGPEGDQEVPTQHRAAHSEAPIRPFGDPPQYATICMGHSADGDSN